MKDLSRTIITLAWMFFLHQLMFTNSIVWNKHWSILFPLLVLSFGAVFFGTMFVLFNETGESK